MAIRYASGEQVMAVADATALAVEEAKGVRILDNKESVVRDIWAQKVKYVDGMELGML